MSRGLSLYLDVVRFGMALIVWIGHATFHGFTGYNFPFWYAGAMNHTAVIGFFVLSGFVIAHVTSRSEQDLRSYTIARVSRLWSVVIPALLLTYVCDSLPDWTGISFTGPAPIPDNGPTRYVLSFLLIQDFWIFGGLTPGSNTPFWSLSYEAVYYVCYGLFLTRKPVLLAVGTAVALMLAGPRIASYFPVWILGVLLYRYRNWIAVPKPLALVLFCLTIGMSVYVSTFRIGWNDDNPYPLRLVYAEALCISANIFLASALSPWLELMMGWCERSVRALGGTTFAIYLCHYPLMRPLTFLGIDEPGTWRQYVWLFGAGFAVMAMVSWIGNHGQRHARDYLRHLAYRSPRLA